VSARDELLREMTHNHLYMTDEQATDLVDAFAHELAEQLRQQCECGGMGTCYCLCADRIDPEVQLADTEGDTP
jgi:hypothetical protein